MVAKPEASGLAAQDLFWAGLFTVGCVASRPPAPPSSARGVTESPARCEHGTLGIEASAISRQVRKNLALPEGLQGALVAEVLPGGPAAAAGIRLNDIVEKIGPARIANDCEFIDAAYSRPCDPVLVERPVPVRPAVAAPESPSFGATERSSN